MKKGLEGVGDGTARLTDPELLEKILNVRPGPAAAALLSEVVARPLRDVVGRRGKGFRGRLVELGYAIASGTPPTGADRATCQRLADAIEALHSGSLVIDDIEDGSRRRRGGPSLHVSHGVPIALNLGNLLYFSAPDLLSTLDLPAVVELRLLRLYNRTLLRAHFGQALDVGVPVDTLPQAEVAAVCLASMELKSGALFALALLMGACLGGADESVEGALADFGHAFGVGLQMFDDIGNIRGAGDPTKRWEDLTLRRPTWVWACAARHFSHEIYARFVSAVHSLAAGDSQPLETWFDQHDFLRRAARLAHDHVESAHSVLDARVDASRRPALRALRELGAEISRAYD